MPDSSGSRSHSVDSHVVEFLAELASFLVAAGITNTRFSAMARLAFFRAASDQARFGNARLNQSAVAAMTGLTRLQVRQFSKQAKPVPRESRDRLDNIVEGWTTDSAFLTTGFRPRQLRTAGRGKNFGALVRKYGGDIPPRSALRELQRQGLATIKGGYVSLRRPANQTRDKLRLQRTARALAEVLKSVGTRVPVPLRVVTSQVSYPATSDKGRVLLQKRVVDGLRVFSSGIQTAGVSAAMDAPPKKGAQNRISRTRILVMTEDFEG
jgi:hypothetical protein